MRQAHFMSTSLLALGICAFAAPATAQSRCGATYEIQPGDTLYQVTQQCRVSLSRIYDLNEIGNPRDIAVGTELRLAADAEYGDDGTTRSGGSVNAGNSYRVEEGDTPYAIAQALGVSLMSLLAENEDLDPLRLAVGETLDVPDGDRTAAFNVSPLSGQPGQEIDVTARGLTPNAYVTLGAGLQSSEWQVLRDDQVSADGELRTEVQVPTWADEGDILTFVIDTDQGVTLKSRDFDVVDGRADYDDGEGETTLTGRVERGVECYTLTTSDGDLWSLVSDEVNFTAGERVEVSGDRADMSFCQQGIGTLDVETIEEVS